MASSDSTSASPECRAIRCHFASLAKAITDPLGLSMELFSKEIIEEVTMEKAKLLHQTDREKNSVLLSAVMRRVEARPSLFPLFLDLLKDSEDHIIRELGGKLETTYNQYAKQVTTDTKEQSSTNYPSTEKGAIPFSPQAKYIPPPLTQADSLLPQSKTQSSPPPVATHPSLLPPLPQSPVCRYANYLRAFYQTSELPAYNKWPPTPSKIFINLALIGRDKVSSKDLEKFMLATLHGDIDQILNTTKAPIQIEEILTPKPGNTPECVLVEGAPGVGKTTLAWQICKKWGKGKLFQQFAVVILIRLRDQTVQNAQSISDLVLYRYHREEISQHLIQTDGRDVLIILEGLDELPTHLLTQSSIFMSLLSGEELPHATILVTSRPSTAFLWKQWRHRVSQHIEVLGFTEENITQYITSVLPPEQLPDFQDYLSINPHIKTMMYIPLNAAIVIEVYQSCQHPRKPLPRTLTQLYTSLVHIILHRYLGSHPGYKEKEIHLQEVTDLPPPVYKDFYSLTQLAYVGVMQQNFIFQDQEQPITIQHLGFMNAVTELFPSISNQQVSYSYNFLHLSIQEYLAAYYASTKELHQQEQLLETMCEQTHLQNMARFLAGITHFKDMDRAIVKKVISKTTVEIDGEEVTRLSAHALQLLHECRDASILERGQSCVYLLTDYNPLFDYSSLGFCITHSNCKWRLQLGDYFQNMKSERIEVLVQALKDHTNSSYQYSIDSIYCYSNIPECVEQLTRMPQNILSQLHTMILWTDRLLFLNDAIAMHKAMQALASLSTLKKLDLCCIDHYYVTALCQWLSTSPQLVTLTIRLPSPEAIEKILTALTTNTPLRTLIIVQSEFNITAGKAMCSMLIHNNRITRVGLQFCGIDDDIVCCLAEGLHQNNTLTTLSISQQMEWSNVTGSSCGVIGDACFGYRGAESIAQALHSNNTLTTLDVSYNSISDRGAEFIAKILQVNSTLTTLDIHCSSISDIGAEFIAQALHSNNTLTILDISYNSISDRGAEFIAQALHSNNILTTLNIGSNSIGYRGIDFIAQALHINSTLSTLHIDRNSISEKGAESIAKALECNNTLSYLNISNNSVSDSGAESIAQALYINNTLTTFNMNCNSISDKGALCIARMLKRNNTLRKVDLSFNKIGNEGKKALSEVEQTNKHIKLSCIMNFIKPHKDIEEEKEKGETTLNDY